MRSHQAPAGNNATDDGSPDSSVAVTSPNGGAGSWHLPSLWVALTSVSTSHRQLVAQQLADGAQPAPTYYVMIVLSCLIATAGLETDSTAVVIGAMLVSPLMGPIIGLSEGVVAGQARLVWIALFTLITGAGMAVLVAGGMGALVVAWAPDLLGELPREVVARTRPTLFDLAIALGGGLAGAYATAHPRLSSALPGVAIATALMPPLCTVGILLSIGDISAARGAFLLFLANFAAISASATVVLYSLGFWKTQTEQANGSRYFRSSMMVFAVVLLIVAAPLSAITLGIVQERQEARALRTLLEDALAASLPEDIAAEARLVDIERKDSPSGISLRVTVQSPQTPDRAVMRAAQEAAAEYLGRSVELSVLVSPIARLDAVTPVVTSSPSAGSALLGAVGIRTGPPAAVKPTLMLPVASPSPAPAALALPSPAAPLSSPSPLPLPTPTMTPVPTRTATPTPTAVPTSTPISWVAVALTDGTGVLQRAEPGLAGGIIRGWPEGTPFRLSGRTADAGGLHWLEVVAPDGRVGWIADTYLVPYDPGVSPPQEGRE